MPIAGIEVPEFTRSDKNRLLELKKESPIKTVKCLMDEYRLSHLESKFIAAHINKNYGKCDRCDFNGLDGEYGDCPNCGALNFNWKIEH